MSDAFGGQLDNEIVINSQRGMTAYSNQASSSSQLQNNQLKTGGGTFSKSYSSPGAEVPSRGSFDLAGAAHPVACVATLFFKAGALFLYLFMGVLLPNVITFILVMVMSALDFWTVKNVTGRLLVGLRWWNQYNQKGDEVWRFQSFDKQFKSNSVDEAFFWTAQISSTLLWGFFLLIKVLSLNLLWGILNAINFGLSALNLYGYYKCRGDYKNKLKLLQSNSLRKIAGKLFF